MNQQCTTRRRATRARHVLHRRSSPGYTLLEVLVVLFIIGVSAGYAALSIGDGGRGAPVDREAQRLQQVLDLAAQEAIVGARSVGLAFDRDGYRLCRRQGTGWRPWRGSGPLRERRLPEGLRLDFRNTAGTAGGRAAPAETQTCPQVVFRPTGEATPLEVAVIDTRSGRAAYIHGRADGVFTIADTEAAQSR